MKTNKNRLFVFSLVFWLIIWQISITYTNRKLLIPIPTPSSTFLAFLSLLKTSSFYFSILASLCRIIVGFILALLMGCLMGFLCAKSAVLHILTQPILVLIRCIPVASFTILLFLWLSRNTVPSSISFLTVFPIIWSNIETGITEHDEKLVEMAKVFGMSSKDIFFKITLPSIRPFFQTSVSTGLGFAWKSGVAAEIICRTQNSLGNLLWSGKTSIDYNEVFAVTIIIVILSALLQKIGQSFTTGGTLND